MDSLELTIGKIKTKVNCMCIKVGVSRLWQQRRPHIQEKLLFDKCEEKKGAKNRSGQRESIPMWLNPKRKYSKSLATR